MPPVQLCPRLSMCPRADRGMTTSHMSNDGEESTRDGALAFHRVLGTAPSSPLLAMARAEVPERESCDVIDMQGRQAAPQRPTSLSPPSRRCQASHSHIDLAPEWVGQHRQTGSLPPFWVLAEPSHLIPFGFPDRQARFFATHARFVFITR